MKLEQELLAEGGIMGAWPHFIATLCFYRYGAINVLCEGFLPESIRVKNIANKSYYKHSDVINRC